MSNSETFEKEFKKEYSEPQNMLIKFEEKELNFSKEKDAFLRPIHINKLPGHLHLSLESVNSYIAISSNHDGISLRIEIGRNVYENL
jgi:hypothetical protein